MKTYAEFSPTQFDAKGLGLEDRQEWLVGPCGTNRDADLVTRANWEAFQECLAKVNPTGEDYEIHRFGHWGPGWFEIVLIRPNTATAIVAEECENSLADYPLLSDEIHSRLEFKAVCEEWEQADLRERVRLCSKARESIFAARRDAVPERVYDLIRDHL